MKLERSAVLVVVATLVGLVGCAAKPAAAPPPVATTQVNAATFGEEPRVGKTQRSDAPADDSVDASEPLDGNKEPRREDGRRGGFSGWK